MKNQQTHSLIQSAIKAVRYQLQQFSGYHGEEVHPTMAAQVLTNQAGIHLTPEQGMEFLEEWDRQGRR